MKQTFIIILLLFAFFASKAQWTKIPLGNNDTMVVQIIRNSAIDTTMNRGVVDTILHYSSKHRIDSVAIVLANATTAAAAALAQRVIDTASALASRTAATAAILSQATIDTAHALQSRTAITAAALAQVVKDMAAALQGRTTATASALSQVVKDTANALAGRTQTNLNLKVDKTTTVNSHALSGNITISKSDVGLGNVDNTSDATKPISTATQTALDLKANLASPTFTGTVSGITKSMVGLGNVDNTSDINKPVSTATQTALNLKQNIGLSASATLDFPSTDKGKSSDLTISVPGAVAGHVVVLGVPNGSVIADTNFTAFVSATGVVTCRFNNYSANNNLNPASGVFFVLVF